MEITLTVLFCESLKWEVPSEQKEKVSSFFSPRNPHPLNSVWARNVNPAISVEGKRKIPAVSGSWKIAPPSRTL